jgi:hypothetical protein
VRRGDLDEALVPLVVAVSHDEKPGTARKLVVELLLEAMVAIENGICLSPDARLAYSGHFTRTLDRPRHDHAAAGPDHRQGHDETSQSWRARVQTLKPRPSRATL